MFKVLALVTLSLIILLAASFIVLISSGLPLVDVIFEVASAFGTTGLSRGITAQLDPLSQITVAVVMFIGRVGPLALGFFLATAKEPRVRYVSEQVYLG